MENHYIQSIEMPELEEKKQSYKNLRDFNKRYSVDSIKKHEDEYNERINWKMQQSKLNRSKTSIPDEFKFKVP
jgi:dipeptidase